MKKLFLAAIAVAAITSCEKLDTPSASDTKEESSVSRSKQVQFVMQGISEEYSTRATIQSAGMTDLYVMEGKKLLKHQFSTDADFGLPTITLDYGSHDLTFVASKAEGQEFNANGQWSCSKVKETFACTMNITVSATSSDNRQVQLTRRSSQLLFTIDDAIPSDVVTMHIKAANHLSLTAALEGRNDSFYEVNIDVSSKAGVSGFTPVMNLLTASATDEEDCAVMVEFLNTSGVALHHHERTVKMKANRLTNLKGNYFSGGDVTTISVDDTWLTQYVQTL